MSVISALALDCGLGSWHLAPAHCQNNCASAKNLQVLSIADSHRQGSMQTSTRRWGGPGGTMVSACAAVCGAVEVILEGQFNSAPPRPVTCC